eukprot:67881-Amphidinium_carterae.1
MIPRKPPIPTESPSALASVLITHLLTTVLGFMSMKRESAMVCPINFKMSFTANGIRAVRIVEQAAIQA